MSFRQRFYIPKGERRGLTVLVAVILLIALLRTYSDRLLPQPEPPADDAEAQAEFVSFCQRTEKQARQREADYVKRSRGISPENLFPFDPNTADSATFVRLGLKPWQARNALKYRRKGGRWRRAEDFSRLYGLSAEDFRLLRPYIRIAAEERETAQARPAGSESDSTRRRFPEKYPAGTVIDLNSADTTALKRIPGIGSYYAGKICRYRERLGGFVSVEQIREVEGLPADAARWFSVSAATNIVRLDINRMDFRQLVRHPYLSFEQVKAIENYKRLYGPLHGWDDLRLCPEFTDDDFTRLTPYVKF